MGCERQEPWVVHRFVAVVTAHHDFHVVIKTGCRDSTQMLEGADVLANGGGKILAFDEVEILPARVAQDVAKSVDPPASLSREVDVVCGVIHLGLFSRRGLEPPHGRNNRPGTQFVHPLAQQRIAPLVYRAGATLRGFVAS